MIIRECDRCHKRSFPGDPASKQVQNTEVLLAVGAAAASLLVRPDLCGECRDELITTVRTFTYART